LIRVFVAQFSDNPNGLDSVFGPVLCQLNELLSPIFLDRSRGRRAFIEHDTLPRELNLQANLDDTILCNLEKKKSPEKSWNISKIFSSGTVANVGRIRTASQLTRLKTLDVVI
jgi:hypothetical protein